MADDPDARLGIQDHRDPRAEEFLVIDEQHPDVGTTSGRAAPTHPAARIGIHAVAV
ncbi:MAG: hypothetical protein V9F00_13835 [Nocardioides sp.]